jgi:hypothetical protein
MAGYCAALLQTRPTRKRNPVEQNAGGVPILTLFACQNNGERNAGNRQASENRCPTPPFLFEKCMASAGTPLKWSNPDGRKFGALHGVAFATRAEPSASIAVMCGLRASPRNSPVPADPSDPVKATPIRPQPVGFRPEHTRKRLLAMHQSIGPRKVLQSPPPAPRGAGAGAGATATGAA